MKPGSNLENEQKLCEMAHEVARAASKVLHTRGAEHVQAWRELFAKVEEYERASTEAEV
jgi:hypothetical protein